MKLNAEASWFAVLKALVVATASLFALAPVCIFWLSYRMVDGLAGIGELLAYSLDATFGAFGIFLLLLASLFSALFVGVDRLYRRLTTKKQ